ncbi:MAG TPA: hypothetical protein VG963_13520, partial [Polyangiaceae bacterium]|nr:hypothetical protein [Polyangiaceae bacterium]
MTTWIFFDCFNTLIDDFDALGDESGLGSLPELAVELGAAASPEEFTAAYRRACPVSGGDHAEVLLTHRLARTLSSSGRLEGAAADRALQRLLEHWHGEYEANLRLTPGAGEMLAHWQGTRRFGVVSNFYL